MLTGTFMVVIALILFVLLAGYVIRQSASISTAEYKQETQPPVFNALDERPESRRHFTVHPPPVMVHRRWLRYGIDPGRRLGSK